MEARNLLSQLLYRSRAAKSKKGEKKKVAKVKEDVPYNVPCQCNTQRHRCKVAMPFSGEWINCERCSDDSYRTWFHLECTVLGQKFKNSGEIQELQEKTGDEVVFICDKCIRQIENGADAEDWMKNYAKMHQGLLRTLGSSVMQSEMAQVTKKRLLPENFDAYVYEPTPLPVPRKTSSSEKPVKKRERPEDHASSSADTVERDLEIDEDDPEVLKKIHQLLKLHKQRRREREERKASRNEKRAEVALDNLMHEYNIQEHASHIGTVPILLMLAQKELETVNKTIAFLERRSS